MSYSRNMLLSLRTSWKVLNYECAPCHGSLLLPLQSNIWQKLKTLNLLVVKRGCRGGFLRKCQSRIRNIPTIVSFDRRVCGKGFPKVTAMTRNNLLNIPLKTTVLINSDSSIVSPSKEFAPSILLSNVMSLVPKIDELRLFATENNPDLIHITETWLKESVGDNQINLPGYNLQRKDRTLGEHGGVCLYSKDCIKVSSLQNLEDPSLEVLWVKIRPFRLPRGIPCIVTATVYHPPRANDINMLEYLFKSLTDIEGLYPGCGIILAGDFNHLNILSLSRQFRLKQLIHLPTRGTNTLDLMLTNLHTFYPTKPAVLHPPFGLSDHSTISIFPKLREPKPNEKKIIHKRDTRPSRKLMFGRYLDQIDWQWFDQATATCGEKNQFLTEIITSGLNYIMPEKSISLHCNDPPWINEDLKRLIKQRQRAFSCGNATTFKFYRNKVNRVRKACRASFYTSKVEHLKQLKPKEWWREVKRISGMISFSKTTNISSQLQVENTDHLSSTELANFINDSFLEPMKDFCPLTDDDLQIDPSSTSPEIIPDYVTTPLSTFHKLKSLNPSKAPGPDCIPNWILKDYAEILSNPISTVLNASYLEQKLPSAWKQANITPIPKSNPINDINKHLRPISLTSVLSKLAEDFVIEKYVASAILDIIDPAQFGGIPKSSATQALISMLHTWAKATDGTGASVRVLLFDYRKAFDLIDHRILLTKIRQLSIPQFIINWLTDFLTSRAQRVKLSRDCFSEWSEVPSGVPQGTKLGPWLFILMINDLHLTGFQNWKYIDDTTISEIVPKSQHSTIQFAANDLEAWTLLNKFQLQVPKCKELLIQFKRVRSPFPSVNLCSGNLDLVQHAKILGLTISDDLKWNKHIAEIIKKTNKRMFFIVQLKRAKIPAKEIINFYCTCVRPVLEYSCETFHFALPNYLSDELERVQKRVTSIIFPGILYSERLQKSGLSLLSDRRLKACSKLFRQIINNPQHKLSSLLPDRCTSKYNLRKTRAFNLSTAKTERFQRTFIQACLKHLS